jgi:hypothetical protein
MIAMEEFCCFTNIFEVESISIVSKNICGTWTKKLQISNFENAIGVAA